MSDYAYFYNSQNKDRLYNADSFSDWLRKFFTTGVFAGDLQVTADGTSMIVTVATGYANYDGKVKFFEETTSFTLDTAGSTNSRIDRIVVRRDDLNRDFFIDVLKGTESSSPVAPLLTRANGIYELALADVLVSAGAVSISQSNITDQRTNSELCGIVTGAVEQISFDQITAQFETYYAEFKETNLYSFTEWFQTIQGQLSGDVAGNLQNQINMIGNAIQANLILTSGGWTEQKQTKTMTVDGGVDTVLLGAPSTITQEQLEGWSGIIISDADYTGTTLTVTFTALLDTPSIDIPVAVTVTRTGA